MSRGAEQAASTSVMRRSSASTTDTPPPRVAETNNVLESSMKTTSNGVTATGITLIRSSVTRSNMLTVLSPEFATANSRVSGEIVMPIGPAPVGTVPSIRLSARFITWTTVRAELVT